MCCAALLITSGCGGESTAPDTSGENKPIPCFSLAWSEYPSWSVFGVADVTGIINGKKGELGPVEHHLDVSVVGSADGFSNRTSNIQSVL